LSISFTLPCFVYHALHGGMTRRWARAGAQEGAATALGVRPAAVRAFAQAVRRRMLRNPYHNFRHVVDVTQVSPLRGRPDWSCTS
jgi:hypothetical protein